MAVNEAPDANELIHDAIVRRQIALQQYTGGLSGDINELFDATERSVRLELMDRLADIEGKDFSATTTARLQTLVNAIAKLRADAFDGADEMWNTHLEELSKAEADYIDSAIKESMPVILDTALPAVELLVNLVQTQPLQGRVLADWSSRLRAADAERIGDAIKIGVAQGETTEDIIRRVVGTRALDGKDGVLEVTRRDVASITQTAIATISGEARQAYYAENTDIISEELYVAVLDAVTTIECASLDGNTYPVGEGPQPPIHWNCRSTRVPVLDGKAVGSRPAIGTFADELDGLSKQERAARVAEAVGTVPAETTYQEFLTRQTDAFQDEVLGASRAALFRDGGLTLDKFVTRQGRTVTLDELRAAEPDAFKRAGI